jgi:uncharacterized protein
MCSILFSRCVWSKPVIAIIIDDMGQQLRLDRQAIELKGDLTYSFLPDAPYAPRLADLVHSLGKEVMLHAPMESIYHDRLRTDGIQSQMSGKAIKELIHKQLSVVPHVHGVNNHMGSFATQDEEVMRSLMHALRIWRKRELFFIDSMTTPASLAGKVAAEYGLMTSRRQVFLDHQPSFEYVSQQFDRLLDIARKDGFALAIGHPRKDTLAVLRERLSKLTHQGFELVTVSTYLARLHQPEESMKWVKQVIQQTESEVGEFDVF